LGSNSFDLAIVQKEKRTIFFSRFFLLLSLYRKSRRIEASFYFGFDSNGMPKLRWSSPQMCIPEKPEQALRPAQLAAGRRAEEAQKSEGRGDGMS